MWPWWKQEVRYKLQLDNTNNLWVRQDGKISWGKHASSRMVLGWCWLLINLKRGHSLWDHPNDIMLKLIQLMASWNVAAGKYAFKNNKTGNFEALGNATIMRESIHCRTGRERGGGGYRPPCSLTGGRGGGRGCPFTMKKPRHKHTYKLEFKKNEKTKWQIYYSNAVELRQKPFLQAEEGWDGIFGYLTSHEAHC